MTLTLCGRLVRLEPLTHEHRDALVAAAAEDPSLYQWTLVPQGQEACERYIETALSTQALGTAVPFATVRVADDVVVGSTRFFDIDRWPWPPHHERWARKNPDTGEIGYTWLSRSALRTGINSEAKLLMLTHAFESWDALRVCFHTDIRNDRSRAALERLGAQREGVLRSHRMAADFTPRDSMRYSILDREWSAVKERLQPRIRT